MPCTRLFLPINYEGDLEGLTQLRTCLKLDGMNIILADSYKLQVHPCCASWSLPETPSSDHEGLLPLLLCLKGSKSQPKLHSWDNQKKACYFHLCLIFVLLGKANQKTLVSCHQTLQPAFRCTCSSIKLHSDNSPSAMMFGDLYQGRCSANGLFVGGVPHSANCQDKSYTTH